MPLAGQDNLKLLRLKVLYFLYYGGVGALLPFIPVYLKQTGLTASETGVIIGFLPFVSSAIRPLIGGAVDRYKIHKPVFIAVCLLAGLVYCSLLLVPRKVEFGQPINGTGLVDMRTDYRGCYLPIAYLDRCLKDSVDKKTLPWYRSFVTNVSNTVQLLSMIFCVPDAELSDDLSMVISGNMSSKALYIYPDSQYPPMVAFDIKEVAKVGQFITNCTINLSNVTFFPISTGTVECPSRTRYKCWHQKNIVSTEDRLDSKGEFQAPFWITFVILNFARLLHNSVMSFTDAVAYSYLGEDKSRFGVQRLFGSLGFVVVSVPLSILLYLYAESDGTTNFSISFYVYMGFTCLAAVKVSFMTISFRQKASNLCSALCKLLKDQQIALVLLVTTYAGAQLGVVEGFFFWYLKQLGATQLILGLCVGTGLGSEILFFFLSSPVLRRFGEVPTLQMSLLASAVRTISVSFVTNPWFGIFIQLLHGPVFSLMWAAASAYVNSIAPRGMAVTAQTILGSLVYGIGYGTGNLITGMVYDAIGPAWTFRINGSITVLVSMLFALIQGCYVKPKVQREREISVKIRR
ncbi:major facilitator superfamily domain-containing protein 6-like [Liolophura sinensis]|uniref:major facilitator superfamily domain-containing protein 6-like n=1 Tax=Liolophura sinensis TaxID=3198878 RepID=UPI0031587976